MSTSTSPSDRTVNTHEVTREPRRVSNETKSSFKTTELIVYVLAVIATIVTSINLGNGDGKGPDLFNAYQAMQLITYLTIAYMIARGLAKSGSRDHHDA